MCAVCLEIKNCVQDTSALQGYSASLQSKRMVDRKAEAHKSYQLSYSLLLPISSPCGLMQPFLTHQTYFIYLAMRGKNLTVCTECELDFHIYRISIKGPIATLIRCEHLAHIQQKR